MAYQRFWIEAEEYFFEEKLVQDLAVSTRVTAAAGLVGSTRYVECPPCALLVELPKRPAPPRLPTLCSGAAARCIPRLARRGPHERVVRGIPASLLTASKAAFPRALVRRY